MGVQRARLIAPKLGALGSARLALSWQKLTLHPRFPAERDSREHEEPTTSEMAEETYSPKIFRPKHTRISELKAEAVKKDRRKKLTQSKFVGGAENTAHPRVISAPEMRQESEQVRPKDPLSISLCIRTLGLCHPQLLTCPPTPAPPLSK